VIGSNGGFGNTSLRSTVLRRHGRERERERADYFCDGKTENTLYLGDACYFLFILLYISISSCKFSF
jgi:hypothetical protein